jgi:hypothetical protein
VTEGRYGGKHQALRKSTQQLAYGQPCVRCGLPMLPGQSLDLDHMDDGVSHRGWAHSTCNRRAGAIRGNRMRGVVKKRKKTMLTECCLGIEIAEDRQHTSVAAAGRIDGDLILVELVAEILALRKERTVRAVAIDPRSPGATLVKLLRNAGVMFTQMTSHDVSAAHGTFQDLLRKGKLKAARDERLTAAVKFGQDRRLGGASAWERRGAVVDVSPANAAEFAVWAVSSRASYDVLKSVY